MNFLSIVLSINRLIVATLCKIGWEIPAGTSHAQDGVSIPGGRAQCWYLRTVDIKYTPWKRPSGTLPTPHWGTAGTRYGYMHSSVMWNTHTSAHTNVCLWMTLLQGESIKVTYQSPYIGHYKTSISSVGPAAECHGVSATPGCEFRARRTTRKVREQVQQRQSQHVHTLVSVHTLNLMCVRPSTKHVFAGMCV